VDGRAAFTRSEILPAAKEAGGFSDAQLQMPCTFKGHERSTMVEYKISWAFSELSMQGFMKKPFGTKKGGVLRAFDAGLHEEAVRNEEGRREVAALGGGARRKGVLASWS
jgi:hypothetical protein